MSDGNQQLDRDVDGSAIDGLRDEVAANRDPQYDIDPLFVNRWSPRAMTGETLPEEELMALFEAARWAPSSYNNQHWRFIYAEPTDDNWDAFVDLLAEGNQPWAEDAAALVIIISKTTFDFNDEYAPTHSLDTGAAMENLALEAARRRLVFHGMQGFDYDAAADYLNLSDEYEVEAMAAIGERAAEETLPEDYQDQEEPNQRKDLDEIVFNGDFAPTDE
ncbi:nitroreductase [halophilic archaeon]|nr:nitroreductase [halophilic archaeon]